MEIHLIPALRDNYIHLMRDPATGATGVVDPAEAGPVVEALAARGWRLTHIFNTHHHGDHIGGNTTLKARFSAPIIAARADLARIPDVDIAVAEGESVAFGALTAMVMEIPGHTVGHIAFWFRDAAVVFCGDTLFALGCGRLFEGTAGQMWSSLDRLRALPDHTVVCCGHEYTLANAHFAVTLEPGNAELVARAAAVADLRARGLPTLPTTIGLERRANPCLRVDVPEVQRAVNLTGADPAVVFAEIRHRKDIFPSH
jgi:hydroxyacylglutathione hydrolase